MFFYEDYHYGENDQYSPFQLSNASYPYHFHRCFELIFMMEGVLSLILDEKEYTLSAGDTVLIFPNQLHSFTTIDHSLFNIIIFSPDIIDDFVNEYNGCIPEQPILHNTTLTLDTICTQNIYEQKSLLYHLCGLYITQSSMIRKTASNESTLLHTMLSYVSEHYHEACTLQELASQIGYEYTYLSKYFKEKMQISYTSYLNQLRIRQACLLLKDTQYSIAEIAFQCGYDTLRTFNRNFLSITGKTPKEFR